MAPLKTYFKMFIFGEIPTMPVSVELLMPPIHRAIQPTDDPISKMYLHFKNLILVPLSLKSGAQSGNPRLYRNLWKKSGALPILLPILDVRSTNWSAGSMVDRDLMIVTSRKIYFIN